MVEKGDINMIKEQKIEQPKVKQKEFDNKPPKPLVTVPKTPKADVKWMEIQSKEGKIKVEINKMLGEMVKKLKPEKVEAIIEQLQNAVDEAKKIKEDKRPVLGECFKDISGHSYTVIGRDVISDKPKAILRKGNERYTVEIKELYEKSGEKKPISTDLLEDCEIVNF
jgi:hypothetical protein